MMKVQKSKLIKIIRDRRRQMKLRSNTHGFELMIKQCVAKHKNSENLMHLGFMIICIIGFAGFLRIGEMLEIKIKHISIFDDRVEILIPKSKTDQLREGYIVHIAKTETTACFGC